MHIGLVIYDAAINFKPGDADAFTGRGSAHVKLGNHRAAIADARAAIQADKTDPRVKYMPPDLVHSYWSMRLAPETTAALRTRYRTCAGLVRSMHRAGVPFLAGTDTINPFVFPGFSLHDELGLLVAEGGFTPLEALQSATREPARFLGREKDLGTVEPGKLADLVLLEADPLADIHNTTKIAAVVANGRLLPRRELDRMLAKVAAANKQK